MLFPLKLRESLAEYYYSLFKCHLFTFFDNFFLTPLSLAEKTQQHRKNKIPVQNVNKSGLKMSCKCQFVKAVKKSTFPRW